jgi:hypothetical protein
MSTTFEERPRYRARGYFIGCPTVRCTPNVVTQVTTWLDRAARLERFQIADPDMWWVHKLAVGHDVKWEAALYPVNAKQFGKIGHMLIEVPKGTMITMDLVYKPSFSIGASARDAICSYIATVVEQHTIKVARAKVESP